jgi:hypothetical protein
MFQQLNEELPKKISQTVNEVRTLIFEGSLRKARGLLHDNKSSRQLGKRGEASTWSSPEHILSALTRAIEAIEFVGWMPKRVTVRINKRWNIKNVRTATLNMTMAYWREVDGLLINDVDSSQMKKWLDSLGLPKFSKTRAELRQVIAQSRRMDNKDFIDTVMKEFINRYFIPESLLAT